MAIRPLGVALTIGTVIVAFGCVCVGVHWTADVVAGAVIGAACGLAGWWLFGIPIASRFLTRLDRILPGRALRESSL